VVHAKPLWISCNLGLGDAIYARPFVLSYTDRYRVWVTTAWPELWWDRPDVMLAPARDGVQINQDNVDRQPLSTWTMPHQSSIKVMLSYAADATTHTRPILDSLAAQAGVTDFDLSVPLKEEWKQQAADLLDKINPQGLPICVYRPPTIRKEWPCISRAPDSAAMDAVVDDAAERYLMVSVAHMRGDQEVLMAQVPKGPQFLNGEIPWTVLMAVVARAYLVLGSPCMILPMAFSQGTPNFMVYGGYLAPEFYYHPTLRAPSGFVAPEPFCRCMDEGHDCAKDLDPERAVAALRRFEADLASPDPRA